MTYAEPIMSGIDLHTHSTASDGSLTPAKLVYEAKRLGLQAIALADHDTAAGLPEAMDAGQAAGLEVIPGVEISAEFAPGTMHILGLWAPPESIQLAQLLDYQERQRRRRIPLMVQQLNDLGMELTVEEVQQESQGGTVGRPHVAHALIGKGYVKSVDEAFNKFIGKNSPAYVPKAKVDPIEAIRILKEEGATAILAHPYTLGLSDHDLEILLIELKSHGLDGIEVYYTEHSPEQTKAYLAMAKKLNLVVSGGSDFHGDAKKDTKLGSGKGNLAIPYSVLQALKDYRADQPT